MNINKFKYNEFLYENSNPFNKNITRTELNKLRFEFDEIYVSSKFIMPLKFISHLSGMQTTFLVSNFEHLLLVN